MNRDRMGRLTDAALVPTARMRRRAATTAVTLTMAGTLGFGLMAPVASGANGPCYDGRCKTTVSAPETIKVDSRTFGFGKLKIWVKSVSGGKAKLQLFPTRH